MSAADAPIDDDVIIAVTVTPQRLAWGTWALFTGMSILLAGMGLFATLVAVRAEVEGFGTVVIGTMSAAYYTGFMVGSRITLRFLGQVGHIRVWAALASVLAVVILLAGVAVHPVLWVVMRLVAGSCISGQYIVAESWLHQLATNTTR
ncbi:MAG: MFS transporter, partial [Ilumatobacteraceae bacterium]